MPTILRDCHIRRPAEHVFHLSLLQNAAVFDHHNPIGQRHCFHRIVSYEDRGRAKILEQMAEAPV